MIQWWVKHNLKNYQKIIWNLKNDQTMDYMEFKKYSLHCNLSPGLL